MNGESVEASIPVEVTLVTAENVDTYGAADNSEEDANASSGEIVGNGSIGLSVSTQNNPFFVTLAEGAKNAAAELNVDLTVVDASDDVTKQAAISKT